MDFNISQGKKGFNNKGFNYEFFDYIYQNNDYAPWDIGHPQKALAEYINKSKLPKGKILDVGCGTGDLSIFLAEKGFEVVGIDYIQKPIDTAREKFGNKKLNIKFEVRDAFKLDDYKEEFDYVFDDGFLHNLSDEYILLFEKSLKNILKKGGLYIVMGVNSDYEHPGPKGINKSSLKNSFKEDWKILEINNVACEDLLNGRDEVPAVLAVIQKL